MEQENFTPIDTEEYSKKIKPLKVKLSPGALLAIIIVVIILVFALNTENKKKDIISNLSFGTDKKHTTEVLFNNTLHNQISYENSSILPVTAQILNASLISKAINDPFFMHSMSSRQFEQLIAEILAKKGYSVSLTQQTRDGGKDIIVCQNQVLGNFVYYIECKKYSAHNPVGVDVVRELYGTIIRDRMTAG